MTNETAPNAAAKAERKLVSRDKILIAVLLGIGGIATFSWVALICWGVIYLIGSVTG